MYMYMYVSRGISKTLRAMATFGQPPSVRWLRTPRVPRQCQIWRNLHLSVQVHNGPPESHRKMYIQDGKIIEHALAEVHLSQPACTFRSTHSIST